MIRYDFKELQYLIQHLAVLGSHTYPGIELLGCFWNSFTRGAILMASGRVPKTNNMRFFADLFVTVDFVLMDRHLGRYCLIRK
jgi:hypothetical protein